jgi:hypothetical protein
MKAYRRPGEVDEEGDDADALHDGPMDAIEVDDQVRGVKPENAEDEPAGAHHQHAVRLEDGAVDVQSHTPTPPASRSTCRCLAAPMLAVLRLPMPIALRYPSATCALLRLFDSLRNLAGVLNEFFHFSNACVLGLLPSVIRLVQDCSWIIRVAVRT